MTLLSTATPPRKAIVVVGVGRSGTSALTRVLNLLGASLPDDLLPDQPSNPRGHWEPKRFVDLNDEIIGVHTLNWWDTRPMPKHWFETPEAMSFAMRVAELFTAEYGAAELPLLKDPRLCRVMPVYSAAFSQLGVVPHVVLPLRHPAEVMLSIRARDSTDPRTAELIWVRHLLEAEFWTRSCPRVWTRYDELLADWRALVARIGSALGIAWPVPLEQAACEIENSLQPSMRHFDARLAPSPAETGPLARRMWDLVQHGWAGDEVALRAGFDAIRDVVDEIDRMSAPQDEIQAALAAGVAAELAANKLECERLQASLADAAEREAALLVRAASLVADKVESAAQQARLRDGIIALELQRIETAGEQARLRAALEAAEQRVAALLQSRSWRLTAPLRALRGG